MPSTKNQTNRIRKSRREGVPSITGMSDPVRRGTAKIKRGGAQSDLPAELPANGERRASGLVSNRKAKRQPEKTNRRGETTTPRTERSARKPGPSARGSGKRRELVTR